MTHDAILDELEGLFVTIVRDYVGNQTWLYDDALQEARIAAWQRLEDGHSTGIAVFAAKQAVIDVVRGRRMTGSKAHAKPITRTTALTVTSDSGSEEYLIEPADQQAADAFDAVDDEAALDWLLSPLSDEQRSVVRMRLDDLTTREIAAELGISQQAVSLRMKKIRAVYGR